MPPDIRAHLILDNGKYSDPRRAFPYATRLFLTCLEVLLPSTGGTASAILTTITS